MALLENTYSLCDSVAEMNSLSGNAVGGDVDLDAVISSSPSSSNDAHLLIFLSNIVLERHWYFFVYIRKWF